MTHLEELRPPFDDWARAHFDRGKVEGRAAGRFAAKADTILTVLAARGIKISEEARTRITSCNDYDQLETLTRRAATAETIYDLFPPARDEDWSYDGWPVHSPFARGHFSRGRNEGFEEGLGAGRAEAILLVLAARGVEISDEVRARITTCDDFYQLTVWSRRAATAETTDDLFR